MSNRVTDPDTRRQSAPISVKKEVLLLGGIGLVFGLVCAWMVLRRSPLGHDEAVYALKARTLVEGSSSAYFWNDYRAPGLPMFLSMIARFKGSDLAMRLGVVLFGGLIVLLTWLMGRTIFDQRVGLIAATGMAFSPVVIASASSVWPDLPGAAIGFAALTVLVYSVRGERVSWWILAAAPLSVAATLIRFGAPIPIGIGALAIAAWRWELVRKALPQVVILGALTAVPVIALLATSRVLGTSMSPLEAVSSLAEDNSFPFYKGLVDYAKLYDFLLLSPAGLLLVLGLAAGLKAAVGKADSRGPFVLTAGVAGATVVVLALTLHGEYRYLTPAYPWLWIAAAYGLSEMARSLRRDLVSPVVATLVLLTVLGAVSDGAMEVRKNEERFHDLRTAARQLDAVAADDTCAVVTGFVPQVAWYSRCVTTSYSMTHVRLAGGSFPPDPTVYLFLVQNGKRQPEGPTLDAYLDRIDGECITVGTPERGALRFVRACPVSRP